MRRIIMSAAALMLSMSLPAQEPSKRSFPEGSALAKFERTMVTNHRGVPTMPAAEINGVYNEVFDELKVLADGGNADAMFALSRIYYYSPELNNKGRHIKMLKGAMENGSERAAYSLAMCYYYGLNVSRSTRKYQETLQLAVDMNSGDACVRMAEDYMFGRDVRQSTGKAVELLEKALSLETGDKMILYSDLGYAYKDYGYITKAKDAYEKALDYGNEDALAYIGDCYMTGDLKLKKDPEKAALCYRNAIAGGSDIAIKRLSECYKKGTGVKVNMEKAERLAKAYSDLRALGYEADGMKFIRENLPEYAVPAIDPKNPPIIQIVKGSLAFTDESGNNAMEAGERCRVRFKVRNAGSGSGYGCVAKVEPAKGDIVASEVSIPVIKAGSTTEVEIPVVAAATSEGNIEFAVSVWEPNGLGCRPVVMSVEGRSNDSPLLQITDYAVSGNASDVLTRNGIFKLRLMLQNVRHGRADGVNVSVVLPKNVVMVEGDGNCALGALEGGMQKELEYALVANSKFEGDVIAIKVNVSENTGKNAESRVIELPLGVNIAGGFAHSKQMESVTSAATVFPASDVDSDIPVTKAVKNTSFALVIANENYRRMQKAEFAANDGKIFGKYCTDVLGLKKENVYMLEDATLNDIKAGINWLGQTAGAYGSDTEIIVYYAGHGIADEKNGCSFIMPSDGYAGDVSTGYAVQALYDALAACPAKDIRVFMDASFTGTQRNGEALSDARAVGITPKRNMPPKKMVVFAAARGTDKALAFEEKGHGMFTYYLLKKLKESKGAVSLGDLDRYINVKVSQQSLNDCHQIQRPVVSVSHDLQESWKDLKMR